MILENLRNTQVILASASPRRQELIETFGLTVVKRPMPIDESFPSSLKREEVARFLAEKKAAVFDGRLKESELVITADTIVCLGDEILNKPENHAEAFAMLKKLSNKTHSVISAVCLKSVEKMQTIHDETSVTFGAISDDEINHYIKKCKPFDKAGAYGIQELIGYIAVSDMRGSFYTVMGFPVHKLYHALKKW